MAPRSDPEIIDWKSTELPDTWPDSLSFNRFSDLKLLIKKFRGKQIEKVKLPAEFQSNLALPKYLLQEFHNLPNGNFSNNISKGYVTGFDISMLGSMKVARQRIAADLAGCDSVLDLGCGGGRSTSSLVNSGIKEVWGLEPSPYLLRHAANKHPDIRFIQGIAEKIPFDALRFEGVSASFVFHEIPPKYSNKVLIECQRILKPNGLLSICEPAPEQFYLGYWPMLRQFGLKGLYFRFLAKRVFEPFVAAWHQKDYCKWASDHGFELINDVTQMPVRYLLLRKIK
jgi:ubiquinone/menaquinone biosynthesis C-methylase UbiE